jgi:hypothetical protein
MRGGGKLFVLAGVALGLVAVALAAMAFVGGGETDGKEQQQQAAKVTVVEVQRDIPAHTILKAEDLVEVAVPETDVQPDLVRTSTEALGKSYRTPLYKGQRLSASQLEQPGLANEIRPGMRAASLKVDTTSLLSGLVQEDDHVDVVFKARINPEQLLGHSMGPTAHSGGPYDFKEGDGFGWLPADMVDEFPGYPAAGDPGSQMYIKDDNDEIWKEVEPAVKVMLQDLRVLRVVRPGETFDANGQPVAVPVVEGAPAAQDEVPGYLVVEVNSQQAEMIAFIQDDRTQFTNKHTYQVVVRGKGDHQEVNTTGITFEILASNDEYGLPMPASHTVPEAPEAEAAEDEGEGEGEG